MSRAFFDVREQRRSAPEPRWSGRRALACSRQRRGFDRGTSRLVRSQQPQHCRLRSGNAVGQQAGSSLQTEACL